MNAGLIPAFAMLCCLPVSLSACATASSKAESIGAMVDRLVNETTISPKRQRAALQELEKSGRVVVPYLVGHLADSRTVAEESINLSNHSPNAFEGLRHYSPKTVHDALSAVLNQITGKSFVFVYNGATASQREKNISEWRNWCLSEFSSPACQGETSTER